MSDGTGDAFKHSIGKLTGCSCLSAGFTSFTCPKHRTETVQTYQASGVLMIDPTESKEGLKYDNGKPDMSLLPSKPLMEIAKVLDYGKRKYDAHNWRKGIDYNRLYAATQRHLSAWNEGQDTDTESLVNHLAHAACDILFLLEFELNKEKYASFDNRYKGEDK